MEKIKLSAGLLIIVLLVLYFCFFKKETWVGFYYPDVSDLTKSIQSPTFKSLDECRVWVNSQVHLYNPSGEGYDYECGKNCRFDKDYQVYICKETIR